MWDEMWDGRLTILELRITIWTDATGFVAMLPFDPSTPSTRAQGRLAQGWL